MSELLRDDHVFREGGEYMHEVENLQNVELPGVLAVPEEVGNDSIWVLIGGGSVEQSHRTVGSEHEDYVTNDVEQKNDHRVVLPLWIFSDQLDHEIVNCVGVQQR